MTQQAKANCLPSWDPTWWKETPLRKLVLTFSRVLQHVSAHRSPSTHTQNEIHLKGVGGEMAWWLRTLADRGAGVGFPASTTLSNSDLADLCLFYPLWCQA